VTASHDAARRAFFFQFGRQAASAVGQVAGMADIVGRTSSAMASELLGLDRPAVAGGGFTRAGVTADPVVSVAAPAAEGTFRSAYRLAGQELVILDQRRLPETIEEVAARRGSDVAYYLRLGVARGGALMAQLAAYGLALTAAERAGGSYDATRQELRRSGQALAAARPSVRLVPWAVERMAARVEAMSETSADSETDGSASGAHLAAALREEADAIAFDLTTWEAAIGRHLLDELASSTDAPVSVLVHGDHGALGTGQLGAGFNALAALRESGRAVRVFLTEGRPFMDGARLASWELRQAGIEHRLIADGAAAWLLDRESIDVVLIRGEWLAANGDVAALVGARGLAQLAAAAASAGRRPRVVVTAPSAVLDAATPDGRAIPAELRPARELAAYLADVPIRATDALVPATDIVPVGLVDALVTEQGVGRPREPR
jgi:methylthioribose-1-phosphate isomerase